MQNNTTEQTLIVNIPRDIVEKKRKKNKQAKQEDVLIKKPRTLKGKEIRSDLFYSGGSSSQDKFTLDKLFGEAISNQSWLGLLYTMIRGLPMDKKLVSFSECTAQMLIQTANLTAQYEIALKKYNEVKTAGKFSPEIMLLDLICKGKRQSLGEILTPNSSMKQFFLDNKSEVDFICLLLTMLNWHEEVAIIKTWVNAPQVEVIEIKDSEDDAAAKVSIQMALDFAIQDRNLYAVIDALARGANWDGPGILSRTPRDTFNNIYKNNDEIAFIQAFYLDIKPIIDDDQKLRHLLLSDKFYYYIKAENQIFLKLLVNYLDSCEHLSEDNIRLLLDEGLVLAAKNNNLEAMLFLINQGACIKHKDSRNHLAFHYFFKNLAKDPSIDLTLVNKILQACELTSESTIFKPSRFSGDTLLHYFAKHVQTGVAVVPLVALFRNYGLEPRAYNYSGQQAVDLIKDPEQQQALAIKIFEWNNEAVESLRLYKKQQRRAQETKVIIVNEDEVQNNKKPFKDARL